MNSNSGSAGRVPPDPRFCDVSLPVPLDRAFTYLLPAALRGRVRPGCRVLVPFGNRRLAGIAVRLHNDTPEPGVEIKEILRLLDGEPVLDSAMIDLGRWISSYYCAPLGEVLRSMTPLGGEVRKTRVYSLTPEGREAVRQLLLGTSGEEPAIAILRLLERRPLSEAHLKKKIPRLGAALDALTRKGLIELETGAELRDPLRAPSAKLRAEYLRRPADEKLTKSERELVSYLELHPGSHNLAKLEQRWKNASTAARALARRSLIALTPEATAPSGFGATAPHRLNTSQQSAFDAIRAPIEAARFQAFLLQGVTGSGKTEVYLRLIDHALSLGKGALMLVPEIGLTPAVAGQFFHRFGGRVAILHSAFSAAERAEQWRRIRSGAAGVVVGTRSGVFAPVASLGLIIVDEEHDGSYKQEETPRYHGRDVAVVRARSANAVIVMGSATPSLETRHNAESGKYTLIEMPERIESRPMPQVELIDMRQEFLEAKSKSPLSRAMVEAVQARLENREQCMLLLNRRGFSSVVTCRSCGHTIGCQHCAVTLTYHRRDRRLLCHYCGYAERVPQVCPKCESQHVFFLGAGSEKLEESLRHDFPGARIARMDRDTITSKRDYESILRAFRDHDYDILVGTQMIAKGHDMPNVTFVGIINADIGLSLPDFRAAERSFQLLTQAAGRAGRGEVPGTVFIQTLNPEHYAVRFAAAQDYARFYAKEIEFRRAMRYPPFAALANVLIRCPSEEDVLRYAAELGQVLTPPPEGVRVLGPAEAPVPKLKQEFRQQILLKSPSRKKLNGTLQRLRAHAFDSRWPATALVIDVDPYTLI
jgi:primosomal protein N' (replication factor Y)